SATYGGSGTNASTSCTYADNGTYPVRARIIDKDDGFTEYTTNVTVNNVKPSVTPPSDQTANEGASTGFNLGSFSDPGTSDNPWTATWSWDGTADTTATQTYPANGTDTHNFSQTHQYTTAGCNHTATVKITDKDLGYDTKTTTVGVGTGGF